MSDKDLIAHLVMTNNAEEFAILDDQIAPPAQVLSMYTNVSSTPVPLLTMLLGDSQRCIDLRQHT